MTSHRLDDRYLRSALEFAVQVAAEASKLRPAPKFPAGLKRFATGTRIPGSALTAIRRLVESDDEFRARLGVAAVPELVDEIGMLWLTRPDGWQAQLVALAEARSAAEHDTDLASQLRRADKRRAAAESVAVRAQTELAALAARVSERDVAIDLLRSEVAKHVDTVEQLRADVSELRTELRHSRDRERAATERANAAADAVGVATDAQHAAEHVRDDVLRQRTEGVADRSELTRLAALAESLAAQLAALGAAGAGRPTAHERRALPMPGGVMGNSVAAAEYLLRSGASIVVDGYNVAKLAWPRLDLAGQRVVLLDLVENLARRFGCDVTVVFDGADVIGASSDRRRVVRVMFSPEGVIADDVIRDEVRRLPATRPVVVVTDDQAIVRDVRAMGANTLHSDQFVLVATNG